MTRLYRILVLWIGWAWKWRHDDVAYVVDIDDTHLCQNPGVGTVSYHCFSVDPSLSLSALFLVFSSVRHCFSRFSFLFFLLSSLLLCNVVQGRKDTNISICI